MNKKIFTLLTVAALTIGAYAATAFTLTEKENAQITEEAEDWIDNMPAGLQDRLSDAVYHAMRGFNSEIESIRNYKDTSDFKQFPVIVAEIKGGGYQNIPMRVYVPVEKKLEVQPILIFFHGGGWSLGSLDSGEKFCRSLAALGNITVISVDYPLAPEHPYPASINVCNDAVKYIYANVKNWNSSSELVNLGGDGAGANLAIATFESLPVDIDIKSLVLYYPLIKTSGQLNAELKRKYGRGFGFDSRLWESFIEAYKGEELESKRSLPPTLLINAGRDIILDQSREFSSQSENIISVELKGALHGFISDGQQNTALKKSVEFTNDFIMSNK